MQLSFKLHINVIVAIVAHESRPNTSLFLSHETETLIGAFITYVRPLLEYCTPIWSPYSVGMIKRVESVQRAFTKKLPYMKCLTYKKRLSAVCLKSLELRRLKADLTVCFKILRGFTNIIPSEIFVWSSSSTRGNSNKLYYQDSRVTVRQNLFSVRVVQVRNKLPEEVVSASSVSAFISRINSMHVSFLMFCFSAVCFFIYVSFRAVVSAF